MGPQGFGEMLPCFAPNVFGLSLNQVRATPAVLGHLEAIWALGLSYAGGIFVPLLVLFWCVDFGLLQDQSLREQPPRC